jgi:hypothetical protein
MGAVNARAERLVAALENLAVTKGMLHQMAERGQLLELACEMPTCLCPSGRTFFEERVQPMPKWAPNADHYPVLRSRDGMIKADNVRLSHVWCNNLDFGLRTKISAMIEGELSLEEIADDLNGSGQQTSFGGPKWTAAAVRRALVS